MNEKLEHVSPFILEEDESLQEIHIETVIPPSVGLDPVNGLLSAYSADKRGQIGSIGNGTFDTGKGRFAVSLSMMIGGNDPQANPVLSGGINVSNLTESNVPIRLNLDSIIQMQAESDLERIAREEEANEGTGAVKVDAYRFVGKDAQNMELVITGIEGVEDTLKNSPKGIVVELKPSVAAGDFSESLSLPATNLWHLIIEKAPEILTKVFAFADDKITGGKIIATPYRSLEAIIRDSMAMSPIRNYSQAGTAGRNS